MNSFDREVVFSVEAQDLLMIRLYSDDDVVYSIRELNEVTILILFYFIFIFYSNLL